MDDQWFYGQNGQQRGPVELAALRELARVGQLSPGDLVWRQGMADWAPASQVLPELFAPPFAPPSAPPSAPSSEPVWSQPPPQQATSVPPTPMPPPVAQPLGYETPVYNAQAQNGRAVASLVLGILSIPSCLCPLVGIPMGIIAIVLGVGVNPGPNRGMAIGGIVCGAVGLLVNAPTSISWIFH